MELDILNDIKLQCINLVITYNGEDIRIYKDLYSQMNKNLPVPNVCNSYKTIIINNI